MGTSFHGFHGIFNLEDVSVWTAELLDLDGYWCSRHT